MPERLLSARFNVEAIAFLEFERVEELNNLLTNLEKTFSVTGTPVAQAIESEIQQLNMPAFMSSIEPAADEAVAMSAPSAKAVSPQRLLQLAVFAQILLLLSETHSFLRRGWNIGKTVGRPKKSLAKDNNVKPSRSTNYTTLTENYQNRVNDIVKAAATEAEQLAICNTFAETFKQDDEVKVGSDEDDDARADDHDDARSESGSVKSGSAALGTPRKRKRSSTVIGPGPPKKKGRPRKLQKTDSMATDADADADSEADADADADADWD
jgi:cohesin loading factor subunit SCC2